VYQGGVVPQGPYGVVDTPADGALVSGSVAITGWAVKDTGVGQVQIYRDPVSGEPPELIFVGNATFVPGARPDVAAIFPSFPFSDRAGWGYLLLTNGLPNQGNGTFRLWIFADGTLVGTKSITAANASATAPFGAIDTPGQGAVIAGTGYVNFGWALTPQPKIIPFDGTTIHVLVDGVDVGPVNYNFYRADVSTLFPGLSNSGGPVGYRVFDTTALAEGLHTIAWLATDNSNLTSGLGSRYFTVSNSAWQPALGASFLATPPAFNLSELTQADATTVVPPRVDGVDLGRKVESLASLALDPDGIREAVMSNLQRLQLSLAPSAGEGLHPQTTCPASYAGYLMVNGQLQRLPVGSSLDPTGTFYWHPGPGFFGTYRLLFVRTSCDGARQRIPVAITIR
jgi:hypothetical protein